MNEELLQIIAKSLTHLVYRNSIAKDFHAAGNIDDATMKIMEADVNDRIYTLLSWYTSDSEEDRQKVKDLVQHAAMYGVDWEAAEKLDVKDFK